MDLQTVLTAISTVGFPIAVTCYLLVRFEKKMEANTAAIHALLTHLKTRKD